MRTSLALAFTSLLALSAPALAQSSTDPNGSALPMSGHNPPGSGVAHPGNPAPGYNKGLNEGRAAAPDNDMRNGQPMNRQDDNQ